jgi:hypothetical protein
MNKIYSLLIVLLAFSSNAQEKKSLDIYKDTTAIVFKAKLLVIERKGFFSENKLEGLLNDMKYKIYVTKDYCFVIVNPTDYVIKNNNEKIALFGNCKYYLAYSFSNNLYFKLGGFESENINEFSSVFLKSSTFFTYKDDVLDENLIKFLDLVVSNKKRKVKKVFPICNEIMSDEIRLQ